ncbi:phage portal protein [Propionibacteriaceae bacterium G57]|uniref:phage portal protein n=1 Tax=Aestuariimicrobium sp. G57 TaxID=3418485 RepID=UPI003DA7A6AD
MGFMQWLGFNDRSETPTEPAPSTSTTPAIPTRSSAALTLDRAVTIPAVYRAISVIATSCAQLDLDVYRAGQVISPTPSLARRPDAYKSLGRFIKRTVVGMAGTGNAYWRRILNADGSTINLEVLDPLAIYHTHDDRGRRWWHYYNNRGAIHTLSDAEVVHLRLLEMPGHVLGLGPVQACRQALTGTLDLRAYADGWFNSAGVPTGVLKTDQRLTAADADLYRERWHQTQANRDIAVLGLGLDYAPTLLSPADAQFLESQQFSTTDVARMFGVPAPYLLAAVEGSSMTYANLEQVDAQFARTTLMAYLGEIEDALTDQLPHGQRAKFNLGAWLRPDSGTAATIATSLVTAGIITPAEARPSLGYHGPAPRRALEEVPQ